MIIASLNLYGLKQEEQARFANGVRVRSVPAKLFLKVEVEAGKNLLGLEDWGHLR